MFYPFKVPSRTTKYLFVCQKYIHYQWRAHLGPHSPYSCHGSPGAWCHGFCFYPVLIGREAGSCWYSLVSQRGRDNMKLANWSLGMWSCACEGVLDLIDTCWSGSLHSAQPHRWCGLGGRRRRLGRWCLCHHLCFFLTRYDTHPLYACICLSKKYYLLFST